ncbi:proton-conducting transporter membrane subunit [Fodinibius sp.]|uniref:proton-conducting transporter transmembrane domain-containing protein n=1 Tax=Fodinibius sp. TaxID=1872440 RepID=UPI002ACD76F4|nr:proton-conducting transporter membrane subunit [Fodinibius sp.]MDZ7660581.1 proton-conducting transporter membrane subunit [Fodinibius sp.]
MWTLTLSLSSLLSASFFYPLEFQIGQILLVDHLALIISTAVTLFSSIVLSYSARYMAGHKKLRRFLINCVLFTVSALLMAISNHVLLFIASWLSMGLLMAELIGGYTKYHEGKASKKNARNYFLVSTALVAAGLLWLAMLTGAWSISEIISLVEQDRQLVIWQASLLLIAGAVVQSALFPFQRWLMSSMTAPTPASALMHAGFVNAGAVLLTRTATVIYMSDLLWVLVMVGGIGALIGKFSKFVQANIKQKLACSTTAQMGFMLLQCGLGFFSAAVAHLILHGFYKAYLFLSSGSNVVQESPYNGDSKRSWKQWYLPVTLLSGLAGGWLFAISTGKGLELNSGLFLTFVIVLTVIHGAQDFLGRSSLPLLSRLIALPLIIIPALLAYAVIFNGISVLMQQTPMAEVALPIGWDQITIGVLYLATFLTIELKWYKKSRRLYVYLLNVSQPKSNTILQ